MTAIGDPMVWECRTPETTSARSVSIFIRPPRPKPCWRRQSWWLIDSIEIGIPAGRPVSVATRHSPWDSPAVSKRNVPKYVTLSTWGLFRQPFGSEQLVYAIDKRLAGFVVH